MRSALADPGPRGLTIADASGVAPISVADDESAAVRIAAANLADDLRRVCGVGSRQEGGTARIVVGTLGCSAEVDAAVAAARLDLSPILDADGQPRWEAFLSTVVDDVLYLVGADRRGTIYAVYDLSEAAGVSPWHWWGDVPVRSRAHVTIRGDAVVADWPAVKYRGIFINDEEELDAWARIHTADGTIGPETYARVFELILRLRGNYIWPAMHVGAFNHDPANGRLAHELGVVVGTSHCDMLLRSNEHEFRPWATAQGEPVEYDYSIPGRNRELLQEYWRGSIIANRDYEVTWTVGMRGIHDYGFQTTVIDTDPDLEEDAKFRAKVRLLGEVIADQRNLMAEQLGADASTAPQLFVPYKEVLPLYDAGLEVPDDVTIVWADDNFGHIRRLPAGSELGRSGGHGLYYHSSYWSNLTTSYLATSSTPLALMKSELGKAWDGGIRQLWVDNIGGIKPLEAEMEFFLRLAWDAGKETGTADVETFTADWIDRQFSGGHGALCGRIYATYYQLNNQRKLEHLTSGVFGQVGHGDEAGRRLELLRVLHDQTNEIHAALPEAERDAFLQLFAVKIHLAYLTAAQFYHADRSQLAHQQGKLSAADHHLDCSRAFDANKRALIHSFNRVISDGKWEGIFTPEDFPPPVMPLHPAGKPALRIDGGGLGVVVWGQTDPMSEPRLEFHRHGTRRKWIEVFARGARAVGYTIEADPWLRLSTTAGTVATEMRITVEVGDDWPSVRGGVIRITDADTGEAQTVRVALHPWDSSGHRGDDALSLPEGVMEADGYLSIDPSLPDSELPGPSTSWRSVPALGRYGNPAMVVDGASGDPSDGAALGFGLHLVTPGAHLLEVHRLPTLNSTGRMRVGISVDDLPPMVLESPTTDEHRGNWACAVQDNVERLTLTLPPLGAGHHVLRLHAVDAGFTVSKLVVHTSAPVPSNLGPPFSSHTHRPAPEMPEPDPGALDLAALADVARMVYRTDPSTVPPRGQIYAGPQFWEGATTFRPNLVVPQPALGAPRFARRADGSKDVVTELGTGRIIEADGVLAFEAEYTLVGDEFAWTTPATGPASTTRPCRPTWPLPGAVPPDWTHTQAETDDGTGLAMHVTPRGLLWEDPTTAPGLHFAVGTSAAGTYRVWLLVKYDDAFDDACVIALDGRVQPGSEQFCGGNLATYGTRQAWVWAALSDLAIPAGNHTFSALARKSGLRVDRLYLTIGDELPPVDADWHPSPRAG
nr:glycosyl hydrolase 115 family protein [Tessaracoccus sp. OS52]